MENNQVKFAKILEDIKYVALAQGGFINKQDVYEAFEDMGLSENQMQMVFEYLNEHKIGIDKPLKDEEVLTAVERNLIDEYTDELNSLMGITEGEKEAYVMSAMNDDKQAQSQLITYYLPKVVEIAKLYSDQGLPLEDLIGEGNLAVAEGVTMLGALESPNEADGMIYKLIMDAMEESINENYVEKSKDEKIADKVNKVADEAKKLAEDIGRNITVIELAENTSLSKKAILEAIKLSGNKIEYIDYIEE